MLGSARLAARGSRLGFGFGFGLGFRLGSAFHLPALPLASKFVGPGDCVRSQFLFSAKDVLDLLETTNGLTTLLAQQQASLEGLIASSLASQLTSQVETLQSTLITQVQTQVQQQLQEQVLRAELKPCRPPGCCACRAHVRAPLMRTEWRAGETSASGVILVTPEL